MGRVRTRERRVPPLPVRHTTLATSQSSRTRQRVRTSASEHEPRTQTVEDTKVKSAQQQLEVASIPLVAKPLASRTRDSTQDTEFSHRKVSKR